MVEENRSQTIENQNCHNYERQQRPGRQAHPRLVKTLEHAVRGLAGVDGHGGFHPAAVLVVEFHLALAQVVNLRLNVRTPGLEASFLQAEALELEVAAALGTKAVERVNARAATRACRHEE